MIQAKVIWRLSIKLGDQVSYATRYHMRGKQEPELDEGKVEEEDSDFHTLSSVESCYVKLGQEANYCAPASVIQIYQLQILPLPELISLEQRYKMVCQYCVEVLRRICSAR